MRLKLIVAEQRPEILSTWSEVFQGIREVEFLNINFRTLRTISEIDAVLLMGVFAHERYGGKHQIGQSQIISTRGEQGMPPWVVTTASFPARIEKQYRPDGSVKIEFIEIEKLSVEDKAYIMFTKVFNEIENFNQKEQEVKIKTLGFELKFLHLPLGDTYKEAEAMRRAYIEYCQRI